MLYKFTKDFPAIPAAISEICEMSTAFRKSKLKLFKNCESLEDFAIAVEKNSLEKIAGLQSGKNGIEFVFRINRNVFRIRKIYGNVFFATWEVQSEKSLKRSSAARMAEIYLWDFPTIDVKRQNSLEEQEEEKIGHLFLAELTKKENPSILGFSFVTQSGRVREMITDTEKARCGLLRNQHFAKIAEGIAVKQVCNVQSSDCGLKSERDNFCCELNEFANLCRFVANSTWQEDVPAVSTPQENIAELLSSIVDNQ